jgi:DtxR family Mn-dependent transcriptional regulator
VCDILRKKTIEDYVELVYDLQKEKKRVHTNDIAFALNINPASVTEIFQKLSEEGYVNYEKYSGATLTKKGRELAINTKKKHDTITEFLMLLGVDQKTAEDDACEMEHILHPSTMDIVIKFVEVVKQCDVSPFWLERLKKYIRTGKLPKCPSELSKICFKYAKTKN